MSLIEISVVTFLFSRNKHPKKPLGISVNMTSKTMNDIFKEEVRKFFLDHYEIDRPGSDIWHFNYVPNDPCWKRLKLILSWLTPSLEVDQFTPQKMVDHMLLCYKHNHYDEFLMLGGVDDEPHRKKHKTTDK